EEPPTATHVTGRGEKRRAPIRNEGQRGNRSFVGRFAQQFLAARYIEKMSVPPADGEPAAIGRKREAAETPYGCVELLVQFAAQSIPNRYDQLAVVFADVAGRSEIPAIGRKGVAPAVFRSFGLKPATHLSGCGVQQVYDAVAEETAGERLPVAREHVGVINSGSRFLRLFIGVED